MNEIILEVCRKIKSAGGKAYVVGGSVRDFIMKRGDFKDCDIEVFGLNADQLKDALSGVSGFDKAQDVGKSFGVLKFTSGGIDFDVALPRRERKTGEGYKGFDIFTDPDMSTCFTWNWLCKSGTQGGCP